MAIRRYKPTTPGRRGSSVADFVEGPGFQRIARSNDAHIRYCAGNCDILLSMVSGSESGVNYTPAYSHYGYGKVLIGQVITDEFEWTV